MCVNRVDNEARMAVFECTRYKEGHIFVTRTMWLTNEDYEVVAYLTDLDHNPVGETLQIMLLKARQDVQTSYSKRKLAKMHDELILQLPARMKYITCLEGQELPEVIFNEIKRVN